MSIVTAAARTFALTTAGETNNPFVAWNNLMASATLSGTTPLTGGERANAVSGSTYDRFRATESGGEVILQADFGTATAISFAAIAAHNIHTIGGTIQVERSADAVSWTDGGAGSVAPTDGTVIAWRMETTVSARYWRFRVSGLTTGEIASMGVAFLGNDLVIPRRLYQGFAPVLTPTEVQLQSNVSVGGNLLGSSVITRGSALSVVVNNVVPTFIRAASWLDFQRSFNNGNGFFFAWRPAKYATDVQYCWRNGNVIRPSNTGPRDLMSIEFAAQVYENE